MISVLITGNAANEIKSFAYPRQVEISTVTQLVFIFVQTNKSSAGSIIDSKLPTDTIS